MPEGVTKGSAIELSRRIKDYINYNDRSHHELDDLFGLVYRSLEQISAVLVENEANDDISKWRDSLHSSLAFADFKSQSNIDETVITSIFLAYIIISETNTIGGTGDSGVKAYSDICKAVELAGSVVESKKVDLDFRIEYYEKFSKLMYAHERVGIFYRQDFKVSVDGYLKDLEKEIGVIGERSDETLKIVESLETKAGFASIFDGFSEYSRQMNGKLRKVRKEIERMRYALFVIPVTTGICAITGVDDYRFYISASALMLVVSALIRIGFKKEDQLEQILSKIENKLALSVFHRYQVNGLEGDERVHANNEFNSFMYSDVEASEWNVPDATDSLVKAMNSLRR